jgi:hypothetical protein
VRGKTIDFPCCPLTSARNWVCCATGPAHQTAWEDTISLSVNVAVLQTQVDILRSESSPHWSEGDFRTIHNAWSQPGDASNPALHVQFNRTRFVEHRRHINRSKKTNMDFEEPITKKRSLGKLRRNQKTKDKSPDMTGSLRLQRHTAMAITKPFEANDVEDVVCNIAGWINQDHDGQYLTIEISPKYVSRQIRLPKANSLDFIFDNQEDHN